MRKKLSKIAAGLVLALALSGCARETVRVPVVQASMLASASQASEKFAGVVVSENAVQIPRDLEKSIKTVYVKVGDEVRKKTKLFSYDSDELGLMLDRQELEMERLKATVSEKKSQISSVQKELKKATGDRKTALNIELRTLEADLLQSEFDQKAKKTEIDHTKNMLKNVHVYSPIEGTVRKIEDTSADAYMVIQQSGSYRIKGTLNELSMKAGIREGTAVTIVSRIDPTQTWSGTVSGIDYNNTESAEGSGSGMGGGMIGGGGMMGGGAGSTSYPFYVTLDDTDGLLLGQHVYIQLGVPEELDGILLVPTGYLLDRRSDPETAMAIATVMTPDEDGRLAERTVILGAYDEQLDCYEILDGLTAEEYVADPSNPDCKPGAMTDLRSESDYDATVPAETGTDGLPLDPTDTAPDSEDGSLPEDAGAEFDADPDGAGIQDAED